jgi:hypothetical protein
MKAQGDFLKEDLLLSYYQTQPSQMIIDAKISKKSIKKKREYDGAMVVVQNGNHKFSQKRPNKASQNLHFIQMPTIITIMGAPIIIAFKVEVVYLYS